MDVYVNGAVVGSKGKLVSVTVEAEKTGTAVDGYLDTAGQCDWSFEADVESVSSDGTTVSVVTKENQVANYRNVVRGVPSSIKFTRGWAVAHATATRVDVTIYCVDGTVLTVSGPWSTLVKPSFSADVAVG